MTTRKELVEALRERYRSAAFGDRIKILDEFVALIGYYRKHAIRVLRKAAAKTGAAPARNRLYDEAVRQVLTMLWEAADRVSSKRLKALIPVLVDALAAGREPTQMPKFGSPINRRWKSMPALRLGGDGLVSPMSASESKRRWRQQ